MSEARAHQTVVMISATSRDLAGHRRALIDVCNRLGMIPKAMEHLSARHAGAVDTSMDMVDAADVYLGVIAHRYGHVPKGSAVSITEMEYRRALRRRIPCLLFLRDGMNPLGVTGGGLERWAAKLVGFRKRLESRHVVGYFSSVGDLKVSALQALSEYRRSTPLSRPGSAGLVPDLRRVAVMNRSAMLPDAEARKVVRALQLQVDRDFAPTWGVDARLSFVGRHADPAPGSWWLTLLDDADQIGALGYCDSNEEGLPLGCVFVRNSARSGAPWSVTASHILLDLLVNPRANLTVCREGPGRRARVFAYEVCNPCAAGRFGYEVEGVRLSDFVLPAWFEAARAPGSTRFDHAGHITRPYLILPGGYAMHMSPSSRWQITYARDRAVDALTGAPVPDETRGR
jgi:hypothetical protein